MLVALANLDIVGVATAVFGIWALVACVVGPFIGRMLRGPQPTFEAQERERVGIDGPAREKAGRRAA